MSFKRKDVEKCALCGEGIATRVPIFFRVKVERLGLDLAAVNQRQGLDLMIGPALAEVMGPDEDLAQVMTTRSGLVCMQCATDHKIYCLAGLEDYLSGDDEDEDQDEDEGVDHDE